MRDGRRSYFHKEAGGDLNRFLNEYMHRYLSTKDAGYICMITGNHDTRRAALELDASELKLAYSGEPAVLLFDYDADAKCVQSLAYDVHYIK